MNPNQSSLFNFFSKKKQKQTINTTNQNNTNISNANPEKQKKSIVQQSPKKQKQEHKPERKPHQNSSLQKKKMEIQKQPVSRVEQNDQSQEVVRRRRLKKKNEISEDEYIIKKQQQIQSSEEDEDGSNRFMYADSNDLAELQNAKKQKKKKRGQTNNQNINEMIKKEKQKIKQPKKNTQKPTKINSDQKKKMKEQYEKQRRSKNTGQRKSSYQLLLEKVGGNTNLSSQEQDYIKLKGMSLKQYKQQKQFQKDLEYALKISQIQSRKMEIEKQDKKQPKITSDQNIKNKQKISEKTEAIQDQFQDLQKYKRNKVKVQVNQKKERKESRSESIQHDKNIKNKNIQKKIEKPKIQQKMKSSKSGKKKQIQFVEGPLSGKTFVVTGEFTQSKDKITQLILSLGGRVTTGVSGKTNYVLQGSFLKDGREVDTTVKSQQAKKLNVPLIPYSDLQALFVSLTDKSLSQHLNKKQVPKQIIPIPITIIKKDININDNILWTQKYKPKTITDIIGQHKQIQQLRKWLSSWEQVQFRGNKHEVKAAYTGTPAGNLNSKAALLSGDPGIGKTTAARLICKQFGYNYTQFNASDIRNKAGVLLMQTGSRTLCQDNFSLKKTVIIMDQVDGLSGGDRGGSKAIIQMIKRTKVPIICICNDRQHEKIRSLAGHCYDIRFFKPDKRMIIKRVHQILNTEGITTDQASLQHIVQSFNNDIRQILNYLNIYTKEHRQFSYLNTKSDIQGYQKDKSVITNMWGAATRLLNRVQFSKLKLRQRLDLFFIDSQIIPLFIQQNLISSMPKKTLNSFEFKEFVSSIDSFAISDKLNKCIRVNQQWGLMPLYGFTSCIYPTEKASASLGFAKFPQWLGKNSTSRKIQRQIKQLKIAMSCQITGSRNAVKYDYALPLLKIIVDKLANQQIQEVLELFQTYGLTPQMLKEHLVDIQFNPKKLDLMGEVSSTIKGKFTRAYNKKFESAVTRAKQKKEKITETLGKYDPVLQQYVIQNQEQEKDSQIQDIEKNQKKLEGKSKKTKK